MCRAFVAEFATNAKEKPAHFARNDDADSEATPTKAKAPAWRPLQRQELKATAKARGCRSGARRSVDFDGGLGGFGVGGGVGGGQGVCGGFVGRDADAALVGWPNVHVRGRLERDALALETL